MGKAIRSLGTKFKIDDGNNTTVTGLTSIGGLDLSADMIDVTSLDSDGGYREFLAGFKDAGEVSLEGFFLADAGGGQMDLYSLFESGDKSMFEIIFPPATSTSSTQTTWKFEGVVTGFSTSTAVEDPITFSAIVKVTGKPVLETVGTTP